jgi:hypothetical protein
MELPESSKGPRARYTPAELKARNIQGVQKYRQKKKIMKLLETAGSPEKEALSNMSTDVRPRSKHEQVLPSLSSLLLPHVSRLTQPHRLGPNQNKCTAITHCSKNSRKMNLSFLTQNMSYST